MGEMRMRGDMGRDMGREMGREMGRDMGREMGFRGRGMRGGEGMRGGDGIRGGDGMRMRGGPTRLMYQPPPMGMERGGLRGRGMEEERRVRGSTRYN
jgi:hypothetical protein